ncbi:TIGR04282 family arsenosugar biosynthesis glycosyltransferase [Marinobacterium arenosum]|uniref:TIGR04282 family arsenosugar biosynthesis glycosyltransferase n=1 Tax=Marinobacterium arenosum TaxID=2862496 RepID=UPI001C954135|nr:DUF2064 domain-containing protein [Marinobacterium arenosum]MBY4675086.1 DUF2064 domain-containing protein [Marinobacterium arenosum]
MTNQDQAVLVLLFKRPRPGQGKQRLAADIGSDAACRVAEALLACALERLQNWPGPVVLAPAAAADGDWSQALLSRPALVCPQSGGNLGERINRLDADLRAKGFSRLLLIGSDLPELSDRLLLQAAAMLDSSAVALSPADDGGVCLMANREPWPLLAELPWSTGQLGETLADCCRAAGMAVGTVAPSYDVDRLADLLACVERLRAGQPTSAQQRLIECVAGLKLFPQ